MAVSNSGLAVRAPPALNPEQLALVQPWKDYVSRGLVTELTVSFTPGGTNVAISVAESVPVPNGTKRSALPPGLAKQLILDSGLIPQKGKGKNQGKGSEENLPARSLCAKDMEDSDQFGKRIVAVAAKLGSSTALGRLGSMQIPLHGAKDFQSWWSAASPAEKAKLVIDEKHAKTLTAEQLVFFHEKLGAVPSPFRGSLPAPPANNAEETEANEKENVPVRARSSGAGNGKPVERKRK